MNGSAALTCWSIFPRIVRYRRASCTWSRFQLILRLDAVRTDGSNGRKTIGMHRQITGRKGCDHSDGNTLNECDYNLRPATQRQNVRNRRKQARPTSSRYKGVSFCGKGKWQAWQAYITFNYRRIHFGIL